MKSFFSLSIGLLFLLSLDGISNVPDGSFQEKDAAKARYIYLDGKSLSKGNPSDADGTIRKFNSSVLHFYPSKSDKAKGTILLLPGGYYELLNVKNEGEKAALFLNNNGFDVAILEYPIRRDPKIRNIALVDALKAFRLLNKDNSAFGLRGDRFGIMGFSSGGHLAARIIQNLNEDEQPEDLILINPCFLNETLTGTVFPAVMPPVHPNAKLFISYAANNNKEWIQSAQEYSKTWKGYDGQSSFFLLTDSTSVSDKNVNPLDSKYKLAGILKSFLEEKPSVQASIENPAAIPVKGYASDCHAEKLALIAKEKYDLILVGNSITHNFEKPEYNPVWDQFFGPRKALNLGTSGYRTENIIWNIQNGELDGQSPKVVILEIGTNNIDEKNYPTRHTAAQLAGGMENDWLHPTRAGAKAWAQAMEPLLSELMGDRSLDTEISSNSVIVPVPKLENDSYDWWKRHAEVLRIKDSINPEIVLIGNSITHFWGGEPRLKNIDGTPKIPNGPQTWDSLFSKYRVLNLGFGWDRTQNVLWRLDRGELDGLHPDTVCLRVRSKVTGARIILMAVFPREQFPSDPRRILINEINTRLNSFASEQKITFVDIEPKMLDANGVFIPGLTFDFCHPTEKGYQIWANAIRSFISEPK